MSEHAIPWHWDGDIQVYDHEDAAQGWLSQPLQCPTCRRQWHAVAAVGASGVECPYCGNADPFAMWNIPKGADDHRVWH
jgi:hypothetical protein